jgi:hypothetical protein
MPFSYKNCLEEIIQYIKKNVNLEDDILDIGAGCGEWSNILKSHGYKNIDALEVWLPYIEEYSLQSKYRSVILSDIRDFKAHFKYEFMLMGDILEHLTVEDAQSVLVILRTKANHIMVVVPYLLPQNVYEGNIQETHLQADLTAENFAERYPEFTCIAERECLGITQGVWVWSAKDSQPYI